MKTRRNKKYIRELSNAVIKETHWYGSDDITDIYHAKPIKGRRLIAIFNRAEFIPAYGDYQRKFDAMDSLMAEIAGTRHGNCDHHNFNIDPNARYYIWMEVDGNLVTYGFTHVRLKKWRWTVRAVSEGCRVPFKTREAAIAHAEWAREAYHEDFVVEYTEVDC